MNHCIFTLHMRTYLDNFTIICEGFSSINDWDLDEAFCHDGLKMWNWIAFCVLALINTLNRLGLNINKLYNFGRPAWLTLYSKSTLEKLYIHLQNVWILSSNSLEYFISFNWIIEKCRIETEVCNRIPTRGQ